MHACRGAFRAVVDKIRIIPRQRRRLAASLHLGCFALGLLGATIDTACAEMDGAEQELIQNFGDMEFISLATGSRQPLAQAPAVASVITAEDIRAIGAFDLDDVLETVPGLHVSRSARIYNPIYTIRGIRVESNAQVLVLINGIPITNTFIGNRGDVWGGMPVKNIERIEVIRGPGSALHGADAFAGVINIVTRSAEQIDGTEAGAAADLDGTRRAWWLRGLTGKRFDLALAVEYLSSNGFDGLIEADGQTLLDRQLGTSASRAPGPLNTQRDTLDTRFDLSNDQWRLRAGYQGRQNVGTGAGVKPTLDPEGRAASERYNVDLGYQPDTGSPDWDIGLQLSYFDTAMETDLFASPAGASFPNGESFPNGVIGNPDIFERHRRFDATAVYHGVEDHRLRLGSGVHFNEIDKVRESKNFTIDADGLPVLLPGGEVIDASADPSLVFQRPASRRVRYVFAQDEWQFARDWTLTSGLRWDHYSDFGDTVNPRAALVWHSAYNLSSKLLYGRAFRAPSFHELRNINNPVALGNPDLDPEIIDTVELAFEYRPTLDITSHLNLFRYRARDLIDLVPEPAPATAARAQNTGHQNGHGLEWEIDWRASATLRWLANYAFQDSTVEATNSPAPHAPRHQVYVRGNWQLDRHWSSGVQWHYVGDRRRAGGDPRPAIDDYTLVNAGLSYHFDRYPVMLSLFVNNLFDSDAREPSLNGANGPPLPNDLPLPGRHGLLVVEYRPNLL